MVQKGQNKFEKAHRMRQSLKRQRSKLLLDVMKCVISWNVTIQRDEVLKTSFNLKSGGKRSLYAHTKLSYTYSCLLTTSDQTCKVVNLLTEAFQQQKKVLIDIGTKKSRKAWFAVFKYNHALRKLLWLSISRSIYLPKETPLKFVKGVAGMD